MNTYFPAVLLLWLIASTAAFAQQAPMCGDAPVEGCPCGKLPVCVMAAHQYGLFSESLLADGTHPTWEGFGQGNSDYAQSILTEIYVAQGIQKRLPCVEIILLNAYQAGGDMVQEDAANSGLTKEIQDAVAAGDHQRLKALQEKVDKLFKDYDMGDLPWRDPDLAQQHLINRVRGCVGGLVRIKGEKQGDAYHLSAETTSSLARDGEGSFSRSATSRADTPEGGIEPLVEDVAKAVAAIQDQLFCACEVTLERCVTTDFELSHQRSECTRTRDCCGNVTTEPAEERDGLGMGETRQTEVKCCSPLARARAGEEVEGADEETRNLLDEIWCPGTWELRQKDLDCDGVANAQDATPLPPE